MKSDAIFVVLTVAMFVLMLLYVSACEELR